MSDRFFSSEPIRTERVTLAGPEAHHLIHVMRATVGTSITLFDDSGAEFPAVVDELRRSEAVLRIAERLEINRELPFSLVVGVALPKGDRQKWLVEKLTEIGVTELVPLVTERGVAQPTASGAERLERSVIEAAKQCGRNRLMRIAAPKSWDEWIVQQAPPLDAHDTQKKCRRLIAHPGGRTLSELERAGHAATYLAIGPEGGLTDGEVAAAVDAGWQQISLGPRILRVETAAIALAAALV